MKLGYLFAFSLLVAPVAAHADNNDKTNQPSRMNDQTGSMKGQHNQIGKGELQLPKGAKLLGVVDAAEVHQFPEMKQNKREEEVVGAAAEDRVWQTQKPYTDVVKSFDNQIQQNGLKQIERSTTQTATAWSVKTQDGSVINLVVRNTKPTTIESVQVVGEAGDIQQQPSGMKKQEQMDQNQMNRMNQNQPMNQNQNQMPSQQNR